MTLRFLWVGKTREPWLREGIDDYLGRLRRYVRCEVSQVREERGGTPAGRLRREGERILSTLPPSVYTMVLDERGESFSTRRLAEVLGRRESGGGGEIAFVLGGPDGLAPEVRERADRTLSLSAMTLTHEMARLLLLEQVYRSFTILRGHPYHRD